MSLIKKLYKKFFTFDIYWASSLWAIEEGFRHNPPKKKSLEFKSAWVILDSAELMKVSEIPESENYTEFYSDNLDFLTKNFQEFRKDLNYINRVLGYPEEFLTYPNFLIKDQTTERIACWNAGNYNKYLEIQDEFGINDQTYAKVPRIHFLYQHNNYKGVLFIKHIKSERPPKKKKSLQEILDEFIDKIKELNQGKLNPGYAT